MKYDEKTGKKIPESRRDEILIAGDALQEVIDKCGGAMDRNVEIAFLLRDINISLAALVDMIGMIAGRILKEDEQETGDEE